MIYLYILFYIYIKRTHTHIHTRARARILQGILQIVMHVLRIANYLLKKHIYSMPPIDYLL